MPNYNRFEPATPWLKRPAKKNLLPILNHFGDKNSEAI